MFKKLFRKTPALNLTTLGAEISMSNNTHGNAGGGIYEMTSWAYIFSQ